MEDAFFDRKEWPFKSMEIGETVFFPREKAPNAQAYVHVFARQSKKKFKTRTKDGVLYVKRTQ